METASKSKASLAEAAAKEKILVDVPTAPSPLCLARRPPTFKVAKLTASNDPLSLKVIAESKADLWILIMVPADPSLLVWMLIV